MAHHGNLWLDQDQPKENLTTDRNQLVGKKKQPSHHAYKDPEEDKITSLQQSDE